MYFLDLLYLPIFEFELNNSYSYITSADDYI